MKLGLQSPLRTWLGRGRGPLSSPLPWGWQDSVPYHMGFSAELPHDRAAGFSRASDLRENHKCPRKKLQTLQPNLGTDIPSRLRILCMRSRSLDPAHTHREGIPQGCEYLEMGISGSHLRRSQPCTSLEGNIPGKGNSQRRPQGRTVLAEFQGQHRGQWLETGMRSERYWG